LISLATNIEQRRRVDVRYDPNMLMALRHGTWMDKESSKKTCIKEKEKRGGTHQPFDGTWVVDFMLRQNAGRFMLEKYLRDKRIENMFKINIKLSAKYLSKYLPNGYQNIYVCIFLPKSFIQQT